MPLKSPAEAGLKSIPSINVSPAIIVAEEWERVNASLSTIMLVIDSVSVPEFCIANSSESLYPTNVSAKLRFVSSTAISGAPVIFN